MWALPRPLMPATPTRIASLAPSTRPDDLVPAMVNERERGTGRGRCPEEAPPRNVLHDDTP